MHQTRPTRQRRAILLALAGVLVTGSLTTLPAAAGPAATPTPDVVEPVDPVVVRDGSGRIRLVGARSGHTLAAAPATARGPVQAARAHLRRHGEALGLPGTSRLRALSASSTAYGHDLVRFQQTVDGLPVLGGQLVAVLDGSAALLSVTGEASRRVQSATYRIPASTAARVARRSTAAAHDLPATAVRADRPGRWLYDAALLQPGGREGARAVWRVEVIAPGRPDVRELVLVDAGDGAVALQVDQVAHALDRVICDSAGVPSSDHVCKPGRYDRVEGQPATGVADIDQAFDHTGATAGWYAGRLGVDLTDLIGNDRGDGTKKLRSTTRFCPPEGCPFDNAFWTGDQMVYGAGFASADDVVAHELAHGVIQRTAGLIYWFQSGALNESMSDVLGELVDLADGVGTDTPEARWQLGEDLPPQAGGVTRDMSDPTLYGQPDHTASELYDFAPDYLDNGGVHTNSGVPNKAAYLVVDGTVGEPGGAFNGSAFPGIGADKAAVLYWTALRTLTPAADFTDLGAVLRQSCLNLAAAAAAGITVTDCQSVDGAVAATGLTRWAGPTEPRDVTLKPGIRSVILRWSAPESAGSSPINSYAIHISPAVDQVDFVPVEPSARSALLEGLPAGVDYTFQLVTVTADGTSPPVLRGAAGSALRVGWPGSVTFGSALRVRGALTGAGPAPVAGRTVRLMRRDGRSGPWERVATETTGPSGGFVLTARPRRGARYVVTYAGTTTQLGARSAVSRVVVRQRVGLEVDRTLRRGDVAVFRGAVSPARSDGVVRLQRRRADGTWRTEERGRLTARSRFQLSARVTAPRSTWRVVVAAPRSGGLAAGLSRTVTLRTG